ncbi:PREDICTED: uncharacterized protein LOC104784688 [Camelina sativa]|uniref:Uncharacterized protein LOC104784688 n=1 Tax=Camelina sativa TaxID=90675 RepID=A0ABM0YYT5_CAMSA|nr:PREDICTED: uncharacterized protein LOC104784688 [Camelina sativa]
MTPKHSSLALLSVCYVNHFCMIAVDVYLVLMCFAKCAYHGLRTALCAVLTLKAFKLMKTFKRWLINLLKAMLESRELLSMAQNKEEVENDNTKVIYADVSMERGSFLVQQAMRCPESAKSRLAMCTEDIRDQLGREGNTPELSSQLGAVLGMLGGCSREMGDSSSAVNHFEESIEFLMKLPMNDLEITYTLYVSLNKIGDLKYYDQDLQSCKVILLSCFKC